VLIAGHPNPKFPKMLSRANAWFLKSSLPISSPVEEHLEALLLVLESRAKAIATLLNVYQAEAGLNCAIYYENFTPGIHLSRSITRRTAALGLYVDLDLYFLGHSKE
jgi:hypothetical protein